MYPHQVKNSCNVLFYEIIIALYHGITEWSLYKRQQRNVVLFKINKTGFELGERDYRLFIGQGRCSGLTGRFCVRNIGLIAIASAVV